jgi:TolB-like protein
MRRLAFAALLAAAPLLVSAAPKKPGLAVMDIRSVQGVPAGTATLITDVVVTEVSGTRRFEVVSSADISSLLGLEKQKQLLQCGEDSSCLAELGGALGVDYLLTGTVGLLGSRLRISMVVQNVKKAKVVARQARFCDANEDALVKATEETVRGLIGELETGRAPEVAAAPPPPKVAPPPPLPPPPDLRPAPPPRAEPVAPVVSTTAPVEPASEGGGMSHRTWGKIIGGAGIVLLASGGAFDYLAYAAYQDQKKAATAGDRTKYDDALSSGKSKATMANVLYGVGLAGAGAGAWLFFGGPKEPGVAVVPTEGGALLTLGGVLP